MKLFPITEAIECSLLADLSYAPFFVTYIFFCSSIFQAQIILNIYIYLGENPDGINFEIRLVIAEPRVSNWVFVVTFIRLIKSIIMTYFKAI
jgi:hypothetical protein